MSALRSSGLVAFLLSMHCCKLQVEFMQDLVVQPDFSVVTHQLI